MALYPMLIAKNTDFVGRKIEMALINEVSTRGAPSILIVYGRRRIGKTELLEQGFRERNVIKFEGIDKKNQTEQRKHVLWQLSQYTKDTMYAHLEYNSWTEVFKLLAELIPDGKWTLYFEEVQWLADYKDDFISELKFAWDNYFRHKKDLVIILCGSSPSFIIQQVIYSKSLYNRSQYELPLNQLSLQNTKEFLPKRSNREIMDAYLLVGGIPEYLKWLDTHSSVFTSLCNSAFKPGAFFLNEYKRIFISSLSDNKHYRAIIEFLAKKRFATRKEILKHLNISTSGSISELLDDLRLCCFIEKYTPYNLSDDSKLSRYSISDPYLQFYYKFIVPVRNEVEEGVYIDQPTSAVNMDTYYKWLGYTFERWCRKNHRIISTILGFSGIRYKSGVFFNRKTITEVPGYQFDLIFDRDDRVITLCEIKYLQNKVGTNVISEFEKKLELFPNKDSKTIHKVLVASQGVDDALLNRHYFDHIITLEDIFKT